MSETIKQPAAAKPEPSLSRRARIARVAGLKAPAPKELEPLLKAVKSFYPKADTETIIRAYEVAKAAHEGQFRRSGEPYITHPLAVTMNLAELGMPPASIIAALLHDTAEDTDYGLVEIERDFGAEVAGLVDGVTKLDKVKYGASSASETVRKMVVAMAKDIRVLVIKLADRLHNMQTIDAMPRENQERKARETLEIYAPLAHRLGMNALKWELEDLSFRAMYPKMYEEIKSLVETRTPAREEQLHKVEEILGKSLKDAKISAEISSRPKHYFSVYQKMIVRGRDFEDIYDLVGVRILVDSLKDCYSALGIVHSLWSPVPGRFKDYIAMPKLNMYQSLHTTVIGPAGKPVEVQIRTFEMHRAAEWGIAAHWRYKQQSVGNKTGPDDMAWLRQLLEWQRETSDPEEFMDSLIYDLGNEEVFVFTPKGDVIALPKGSTPVDFAYTVHTEVGHRCVGAKVNNRLVPLEHTLLNGDTIEIITSKAQEPSPNRDWLDFVQSPRARSKIKAWFAKEAREESSEVGREDLTKLMRREGLPFKKLMSGDALLMIAKELGAADLHQLFLMIGEGKVSATFVVKRLIAAHGGTEGLAEDLSSSIAVPPRRRTDVDRPAVEVTGVEDVLVKLARCCTPVPGDVITGFVTKGSGVSVHRADCVNVANLEPERLVEVKWNRSLGGVFLVNIQTEAIDRPGLLSDITTALAEKRVNILSASVSTSRDRVALSRFTFELADPGHLEGVLQAVKRLDGVYDVYRV
ncbi:MAG: RelA/SpoT family protein [Candidatus Nanopelagicales bacterium]